MHLSQRIIYANQSKRSMYFLVTGLIFSVQFSSFQLLSHVQLFAFPLIAACQVSLSISNSQSLLKFVSIPKQKILKQAQIKMRSFCSSQSII